MLWRKIKQEIGVSKKRASLRKELKELACEYLGEEDSREGDHGMLVLSAMFENSMGTSVAGIRLREVGNER